MKQITLIQTDILAPAGIFANHSPAVWWRRDYVSVEDQVTSFWAVDFGATFDDTRSDTVVISSFVVGVEQYAHRSTVDNVRLLEKQFTYDQTLQALYVAYEDRRQYWQFPTRRSGEATNYADAAQVTDLGPVYSQYGEEYVDPRLIAGSVDDTQALDSLEDQRFTFNLYTFRLNNADGELDGVRSQIINQASRIYLAEVPDDEIAEVSDFDLIRSGIVSDVNFDQGEVTVSIIDPRGAYKDTVNPRTLTAADWPGVDDKNIDKRIPLLMGRAIVPAVKVDATVFLLSDTFYGSLTAVHAVYVDGSSVSYTADLSTGTVTLSSYTTGEVTADVTGLDITNIIDQIMWLFETFALTFETSEYFDLTQVSAMRAKGYIGAYYVGTGGINLSDALVELSSGINMWIYPKPGGVYGMKDITPALPIAEILFDELEGLPSRDYNNDVYVSELAIDYSKDYADDDVITILDTGLYDEAINNQQSAASGEMASTLTGDSQAADVVRAAYEQRIFAPEIIDISMPGPFDFDIADYVIYTHERVYDPSGDSRKVIIPRSRWRVIAASKINRDITIRRIDDYPKTIDDMYMLDLNGGTDYLDFNGNASGDIISLGEAS